jgi:hypothetical protein
MSTAATRGRKGDASTSNDALAPSLPPLAAPLLFPSVLCRGQQSTSLYKLLQASVEGHRWRREGPERT